MTTNTLMDFNKVTSTKPVEMNTMNKVKLTNVKTTQNDNGGYYTFELEVVATGKKGSFNVFPTRLQWTLDRLHEQLNLSETVNGAYYIGQEFEWFYGDLSYVNATTGLPVKQTGWAVVKPEKPVSKPNAMNLGGTPNKLSKAPKKGQDIK